MYLLPCLIFAGSLFAATPLSTPSHIRPYRRPITTWIAPYAVKRSFEAIRVPQVAGILTHLDLQFWEPTSDGAIRLVEEPEVSLDAVEKLRNWGHEQGIRVMLCAFNGERDWDWPLAKHAFSDHCDGFVDSLVHEVDRLDLDGIDVDLEGPAQYESDKPAFLSFIAALSKEMHSRRKQLTVDSFCYIWNAPNQGWWADLFRSVDAVNCMGYDETGCAAPEWRSFAALKKAAGAHTDKLSIGMLSGRDKWQGSPLAEHLAWIEKDNTMGVAIWDAQFRSSAWKSTDVLKALASIRRGR
ncbi:MAG: glycosyl hydrolase family 18 protein [Fimbriimonas sp.]|nr:glycosyl hydrolase family 18 protein [Fimbriimonas sp.]